MTFAVLSLALVVGEVLLKVALFDAIIVKK